MVWLHHAVRGHENPALDVAVELAGRIGRPVLAYQGLGGQTRYNNDRHHTFILEGARDAAEELAGRGIPLAFHLPDDPSRPSPLLGLAGRAAIVVTEDFPAPPMPVWTERLAKRCDCPVWAVDSACVAPMRLIDKPHDRAFRFRDKAKKLWKARIDKPWHDAELRADLRTTLEDFTAGRGLGFAPADLSSMDIPDRVARCRIDHTVAPVPHTRGGSRAGYERWGAFRDGGLRSYHRRRNDAAIPREEGAVSRLSPYLHHGHVSPFRIAREAWGFMKSAGSASASDGAEKFLDELLVWRELSHNLCFHRWREVESTRVLPEWARDTLAAHRGDDRQTYSYERLARAQTGDRLWDLAQKSLIIHGELHNNVRMTWGKAVPEWSPSPESALRRLLDLNHTFALDGSDPNSLGGILWTLGMFDRPFQPERPILGTIRSRPTDVHEGRLDVASYEQIAAHPAGESEMRVAVIGGGMAGLTCTRTLADHGWDVQVFDKGRGPGGRMSRKRVESDTGELHFDHGAQYFTARDERFRRLVDSWIDEGVVAEWHPRLVSIEADHLLSKPHGPTRYVGTPGMNALVKHLAETLPERAAVRFNTRVAQLHLHGHQWELEDDRGVTLGRFDAVVAAVPAPQAAALLEDVPDLRARLERVSMTPSWAVLLGFDRAVPVEFDAAFINKPETREIVTWIARNASKPGRPDGASWVVHAAPRWSADHVDDDPESVIEPVTRAFFEALGVDPIEPTYASAHRWRYALPEAPLCEGCLFDQSLAVGACGDWCMGARVEGAFLSGAAMAGRLLGLPQRALTIA